MLQASLYADRHPTASDPMSDSVLERSRRSLSGFSFRRFFAAAHRAVQGSPATPLNDHLLQDIGLTRADFEALRF